MDTEKTKQNGSGVTKLEPGGFREVWTEINADEENTGLPRKEKTFHLEFYCKYRRETLIGNFTIQKLSVFQLRQVGVRRAQLNAGAAVDELTNMFSIWFATLEGAVTRWPDWWKPHDELNDDLLSFVYGKVVSFEESFRAALERELPTNPRESSQERVEQSEDTTEKVVDKEVQPTSDE